VKQNKKDCAGLASRSATLAQLIREQVHEKEELMDDRLKLALGDLEG
jgi:hypothetical protein